MKIKLSKKIVTGKGLSLIKRPKNKATAKLAAGPEKATFACPYLVSLNLLGLTGTGLAHPKIIPPPIIFDVIIKNKGTIIEPIGSMCFIGFNVNLPIFSAVSSPCLRAA